MSSADLIRAELTRAARELGAPESVEPTLERPRDPAFGDWATNFAMQLARTLRRKPLDIARDLVEKIDKGRADISTAQVAPPGFINFRLSTAALASGLADVLAADARYGRADVGQGQRVNVEFVSANPTGPLHVGHGRQAAIGDAVSTMLEWMGWDVSREFYYNDAGAQIENLAKSVWARVAQLAGLDAEIPAGGYHGEYIRDLAEKYHAEHRERLSSELLSRGLEAFDAQARALPRVGAGQAEATGATAPQAGAAVADDEATEGESHPALNAEEAALLEEMRRMAVAELRKEQDTDLRAFGVHFDTYFLETSLYTDGKVQEVVERLGAREMTFEHDGALWLRTTLFGDDKDRVMRKRDGSYTYFVPDVAYHVTKWERGFRRAINVQGADHHSTVTRVRAGLQALGIGIPEGYPEYLLHQMVTVMRGGEEVKISKRAGSYVTVRDLVDEVGRDAVRYFYLMRKADSQLEFDVDLARKQSEENPVYYIQMAHARMSGIFRVGGFRPEDIAAAGVDLGVLGESVERELIKALLDFPKLVLGASAALEPHRVASYLLDTARLVHNWYHKHHVLGEPEPVERARLVLARASQIVIRNGLRLLGITAPERM